MDNTIGINIEGYFNLWNTIFQKENNQDGQRIEMCAYPRGAGGIPI